MGPGGESHHSRTLSDHHGEHVVIHCADRSEFLRRISEGNDPNVTRTATWYFGCGDNEAETVEPVDAEPGVAR